MAKSSPQTVDDYIASQPEAAQPALTQVRNAIRKALPAAEEVISYNIPTYKLDGAMVIYFAGWKHHYSLYPAGARLLAAFQEDLAPYEIKKSTIRFPLSEPVPARLIQRIVKFRVTEAADREKSGRKEPPKTLIPDARGTLLALRLASQKSRNVLVEKLLIGGTRSRSRRMPPQRRDRQQRAMRDERRFDTRASATGKYRSVADGM